jgi:HAD domain family 1 in Swiss Army Knife RNA repair proteins
MSIKTLRIYDFDNTLFRSPEDTPENRKIYEKATGSPWLITKQDAAQLSKKLGRTVFPRSGWWGRAETLLPPLVPEHIPPEMWITSTVDSLRESIKDETSVNLIMTGRHSGLKHEVMRILNQGGFEQAKIISTKNAHPVLYYWEYNERLQLYLLGMSGPCPEKVDPKPQETFPWKVWIIEQFRLIHPEIEKIEIWEDREEHVEKFLDLKEEFPEDIVVHHVISESETIHIGI